MAWNPLVTEYLGSPQAPYYVYLLIDPRDGKVFYVGKGTGGRFTEHAADAAMAASTDQDEGVAKLDRIRQITKAGLQPRVEFARSRLTEDQAFLCEAVLIDALSRHSARLTNVVRGHNSEFGLVSLEELEQNLLAPDLQTQTRAVLIKLGWWGREDDDLLPRRHYGFRPGMADAELYDSTRAWWRFNRSRVESCPYAVAVYQGVTRQVWEIDHRKWRSREMLVNGRVFLRWAFEGSIAPPEIRDDFVGRVGRRIPSARPGGGPVFGSGSPIAYWPV